MSDQPKNPAAVALGKLGGTARAKSLSAGQRSEIASKAVGARKTHKGWPLGKKRGSRKVAPSLTGSDPTDH